MKFLNSSILLILLIIFSSCKQRASGSGMEKSSTGSTPETDVQVKELKFGCPVSNGMKGDSLFFDLSADRKKMSNLMFKGYWRCSGKLT